MKKYALIVFVIVFTPLVSVCEQQSFVIDHGQLVRYYALLGVDLNELITSTCQQALGKNDFQKIRSLPASDFEEGVSPNQYFKELASCSGSQKIESFKSYAKSMKNVVPSQIPRAMSEFISIFLNELKSIPEVYRGLLSTTLQFSFAATAVKESKNYNIDFFVQHQCNESLLWPYCSECYDVHTLSDILRFLGTAIICKSAL